MSKNYISVRELSVSYKSVKKKDDGKIGRELNTPQDVYKLFSDLGNKTREYLVCIHLDTSYHIISYETVSIGELGNTVVSPRAIFQGAIMANARSIILLHCHTSMARLEASPEDINATKIVQKAGDIIGIELLDHIIINFNSYLSLKEQSVL